MLKGLQKFARLKAGPVVGPYKIGFHGGALLASVAMASLSFGAYAIAQSTPVVVERFRAPTHAAPLSTGISAGTQTGARVTLKVLHSFGGNGDGARPYGSLIRDSEGNFYGTTSGGGASGYGTVFKLDTKGNETILVSFNGTNGKTPHSTLIQDAAGNLYGTTIFGGDLNCLNGLGCGVVFKIDTSGNETNLYTFTGAGGDGAVPTAGLTQDTAGNLYGVTADGGAAGFCVKFGGCGTVFRIDSSGNETVLYSFTGSKGDGTFPFGAVIVDESGNIYGTTVSGGNHKGICEHNPEMGHGCGTVFMLDDTDHETVLHRFSGVHGDGIAPSDQLTMDSEGDLYGVTPYGGSRGQCGSIISTGCGTVFKIDASGAYTVLYRLHGRSDGAYPVGPLTLDSDGNLYGAAGSGGKYDYDGGLFELTAAGQLNVLFPFTDDEGEPTNPRGGLIQDAKDNIYGVTLSGGAYSNAGTVFEIRHR
ncbi:MAG TPA: choice-of-anchor tandem repeat GloVer-containing protein [Rhizomicrobium sp.]|jgi:uncharacterized repeat protein (TIGR03803 family)|nr:choice-of-anchor tandem repeat GloVer-containing protein [Rhizomicrobium sp.]